MAIYLTNEQFDKIKSKKIGEGSDAVVYRINKDTLYKIYHQYRVEDFNRLNQPTKIYDKNNLKLIPLKKTNQINYVDKDGVRLCSSEAILKAKQRQQYIKNVDLPQDTIYINNRFRGCVLKNQHGLDIHYFSFLPKTLKRKICLEILKTVKQLTDLYIYPIDLSNKPNLSNLKKGHSNILLNKNLNPRIIDLDGKSTIYRESHDQKLLNLTILDLNTFIIEYLYNLNFEEELEEEDLKYLKNILKEKGVSLKYLSALANFEANFEMLEGFLKEKTLKK